MEVLKVKVTLLTVVAMFRLEKVIEFELRVQIAEPMLAPLRETVHADRAVRVKAEV